MLHQVWPVGLTSPCFCSSHSETSSLLPQFPSEHPHLCAPVCPTLWPLKADHAEDAGALLAELDCLLAVPAHWLIAFASDMLQRMLYQLGSLQRKEGSKLT